MSEPIRAISVISQSTILAHAGYSSLHSSAKCLPVATPRRAERSWIMRPIAVAHMRSHKSEYPAMAPDWRSPSRFPGSRNAMLIRNPGPVNSHSFRHENGGASTSPSCSSIPTTTTLSAESYAVSSCSSANSGWWWSCGGIAEWGN